jgi:hypothetical protein
MVDNVSNILKTAWTEVEKADLPEAMQGPALREAIRLVAYASISPAGDEPEAGSTGRGTAGSAGLFDRISQQAGIAAEQLRQVLYVDEAGEPHVNLPARKLGQSRRAQLLAVTLLLVGARYFGLDEAATSTKVVREECNRLKCFDRQNFNAYLGSLSSITYGGSVSDKRLTMRTQGITDFVQLVERLTGGGDGD